MRRCYRSLARRQIFKTPSIKVYIDLAYIDIQTAKCYAIIVYSPVNNKFIKGSTTDFSITDKSFTADFSKVVFVNRSGTVTGKSSVPFVIQGAVDVHSEKIRIKIGNYTYAK